MRTINDVRLQIDFYLENQDYCAIKNFIHHSPWISVPYEDKGAATQTFNTVPTANYVIGRLYDTNYSVKTDIKEFLSILFTGPIDNFLRTDSRQGFNILHSLLIKFDNNPSLARLVIIALDKWAKEAGVINELITQKDKQGASPLIVFLNNLSVLKIEENGRAAKSIFEKLEPTITQTDTFGCSPFHHLVNLITKIGQSEDSVNLIVLESVLLSFVKRLKSFALKNTVTGDRILNPINKNEQTPLLLLFKTLSKITFTKKTSDVLAVFWDSLKTIRPRLKFKDQDLMGKTLLHHLIGHHELATFYSVNVPVTIKGELADIKDWQGQTALLQALCSYSLTLDQLEVVLELSPTTNVTDKYGYTPLMAVLEHQSSEVASHFIQSASGSLNDIGLRDNHSHTALFYAMQAGKRLNVAAPLFSDDKALIQGLLAFNTMDEQTPFAVACSLQKVDLVTDCLACFKESSTKLDTHTNELLALAVETQTKQAIEEDYPELLTCFLKYGLVQDMKNTLLVYAVLLGRKRAVDILCQFGADVDYKDQNNQTALDYALERKDDCMVRALQRVVTEKRLADPDARVLLSNTPSHRFF